MTQEEIERIQNAIKTTGLKSTKFPKKIEVRIPNAKYPGFYLLIPTDTKSFKLQVFCHQTSMPFLEKLNLKGYALTEEKLHFTFSLIEKKGIPAEDELTSLLEQGLESMVSIKLIKQCITV